MLSFVLEFEGKFINVNLFLNHELKNDKGAFFKYVTLLGWRGWVEGSVTLHTIFFFKYV